MLLRVLMDEEHPVSMTAECLFSCWLIWDVAAVRVVLLLRWTFGGVGKSFSGVSTSLPCVGSGVS